VSKATRQVSGGVGLGRAERENNPKDEFFLNQENVPFGV
jgi:hypothetical protein